MDTFNDPAVETIVLMCSAQVGKTEILNNIVGYRIDQDPGPILVLQPTLQMAEAWSKDRLAPMLSECECLQNKVKDPRARDSGNTLLHKAFPEGQITMAGANSPASLASRPVRDVLADEVDRYPASAGTEGDPVNLAKKRTTTFYNRKILLTSTPTIRGSSRIHAAYEASDQRRYYVPCPECDEFQTLQFEGVKWEEGKPESAKYACRHCGVLIPEHKKNAMIRRGKWVAHAPLNGVAGFHLSELYSPWSTWATVAANFLEAKRMGPEVLKTWVNTSLGEVWEDEGEGIEGEGLAGRREDYGKTVPAKACVLTAGADVQADRIEVEVKAWGVGQESWSMDYRVFRAIPNMQKAFDDLEDFLLQDWKHESGHRLKVACACIDSGGNHTQEVYNWCKKNRGRHWYAIKGKSVAGSPIISKPSRNNKANIPLWPIGTDTAKETIYSRLSLEEEGPGFYHFSHYANDDDYFKQLTAEKKQLRYKKGHGFWVWVKPNGAANEALDCNVYALAAVEILNPKFEKILAKMAPVEIEEEIESPFEALDPTPPSNAPKRRVSRKRQSGFVNQWR